MAATDVLPSSPMSPGPSAPWSGFEDYLDFPSPLNTPRLTPATTAMPSILQVQQQQLLAPPPQPAQQEIASKLSSAASGSSTSAADAVASLGPAPAPGSSPETLFRYYLAAELRKMGNPADDATIDRYVAQHCDSFTRAMERSQASASATAASNAKEQERMNGVQAFRSTDSTAQASSPPYLLSNLQSNNAENVSSVAATGSIDPHMIEFGSVQQSFGQIQVTSPVAKAEQITPHASPSASTSLSATMSHRSKSADEDDEMSEDEDEEDEDISRLSAGKNANAKRPARAIEETPIEGSIMGPANELRPDPETYRKLTSKEKRQLRNKISARNFRTRRKEHISHLEQQVADRDTIIEGLRQQLANVTVQNKDLQEEVRALKSKAISSTDVSRIIEALQKSSSGSESGIMAPPSSLARSSSNASMSDAASARPTTPSMTSSSPRSMSPRPSVSIAKPNTRKDVASSAGGATGARSFWGGVGGPSGNTFTSVHTVLVPSYNSMTFTDSKKAPESQFARRTAHVDVQALADLTRKMGIEEKAKTTGKSSKSEDSDINAALVSLIDGDEVAPPSYQEATEQPSSAGAKKPNESASPSDDRVHAAILNSLNKALSSKTASSSSDNKQSLLSSPSTASLDPYRLQALLEGRARLALVDSEGRLWNDDLGVEKSTTPNNGRTLSAASA